MISSPPVLETSFPTLTLQRRGKVRDVYEVDDEHLLIVATDRISAFDYVLGSGIPGQGQGADAALGVLVRHAGAAWCRIIWCRRIRASLSGGARGRTRTRCAGARCWCAAREPVQVECVARGYMSGSGWKDYLATGEICGVALPKGLRESDRLPETIFTPATKAARGS